MDRYHQLLDALKIIENVDSLFEFLRRDELGLLEIPQRRRIDPRSL